ncbi:unnamed protein product, partial [Prorocentrum cordatum]
MCGFKTNSAAGPPAGSAGGIDKGGFQAGVSNGHRVRGHRRLRDAAVARQLLLAMLVMLALMVHPPKSDESEAVVRARTALAALRRLQHDDDRASIVNLTREARALEAEGRRRRPPDAALRSAQDRMAAKTKEKEDTDKQLAAAEAQVVDLRKRSESLSVEVGALQQEVAEARTPATVSAAGHNGLDLAAMASNLLNLQTLIGNAQQSVGAGQGLQLLQSIHAEVQAMSAAFPAASASALAAAAAAAQAPAAPGGAAAPAAPGQAQAAPPAPSPPTAAAGTAPSEVHGSFRPTDATDGDASMAAPGPSQSDIATTLASFNGSCWNTFKEYLIACPRDVAAAAAQELRIHGRDKAAAALWAARHGWKPYIAACRRLESGRPTAGTGIFICDHIETHILGMGSKASE